jgi:hypothetical protein
MGRRGSSTYIGPKKSASFTARKNLFKRLFFWIFAIVCDLLGHSNKMWTGDGGSVRAKILRHRPHPDGLLSLSGHHSTCRSQWSTPNVVSTIISLDCEVRRTPRGRSRSDLLLYPCTPLFMRVRSSITPSLSGQRWQPCDTTNEAQNPQNA